MKPTVTRRRAFRSFLDGMAGVLALSVVRTVRAATQRVLTTTPAPKGYDPSQHKWLMAIDVDRCIGCGLCVEACKKENHVPDGPTYFRTWIERYIIKTPKPGSDAVRGEVIDEDHWHQSLGDGPRNDL